MAKGSTVIIGCRLPHGLVLEHPLQKGEKVILAGMNTSLIKGATFTTTEVDSDFWEAWKMTREGKYQPLVSGAIFEARSAADAASIGKELRKEKTGFEPMQKDDMKVKPADKD